MDSIPQQERRAKLKEELRDRIKTIQLDIARLERDIIVATDEKRIHEEDLQFHLELLDELGGFESEEEDEEISVDIIEEHEVKTSAVKRETKLTGAEEVARKPTKEEIQEANDKARAWHLDRTREKKKR
jgi:hypothetical protein